MSNKLKNPNVAEDFSAFEKALPGAATVSAASRSVWKSRRASLKKSYKDFSSFNASMSSLFKEKHGKNPTAALGVEAAAPAAASLEWLEKALKAQASQYEAICGELKGARAENDRLRQRVADLQVKLEEGRVVQVEAATRKSWPAIPAELVSDSEIRDLLQAGCFVFVRRANHGCLFRCVDTNRTVLIPRQFPGRQKPNLVAQINQASEGRVVHGRQV